MRKKASVPIYKQDVEKAIKALGGAGTLKQISEYIYSHNRKIRSLWPPHLSEKNKTEILKSRVSAVLANKANGFVLNNHEWRVIGK